MIIVGMALLPAARNMEFFTANPTLTLADHGEKPAERAGRRLRDET
jgi:hypothetical protein